MSPLGLMVLGKRNRSKGRTLNPSSVGGRQVMGLRAAGVGWASVCTAHVGSPSKWAGGGAVAQPHLRVVTGKLSSIG